MKSFLKKQNIFQGFSVPWLTFFFAFSCFLHLVLALATETRFPLQLWAEFLGAKLSVIIVAHHTGSCCCAGSASLLPRPTCSVLTCSDAFFPSFLPLTEQRAWHCPLATVNVKTTSSALIGSIEWKYRATMEVFRVYSCDGSILRAFMSLQIFKF